MTDEILKFFVLFFVVVEPVTLVPLFAAMTEGEDEPFRRRMALKAVCIAGIVLFLFAVGGAAFLKVMGISIDAFRIAGGIMLFLIALEMVFARESGTRVTPDEKDEGRRRKDVSVFPLATPIVAGPGAITAAVVQASAAENGSIETVVLLAALAAVMALTLAAFMVAGRLERALGATGMNVVSRILGILLAAVSAEMILAGLKQSGVFLR